MYQDDLTAPVITNDLVFDYVMSKPRNFLRLLNAVLPQLKVKRAK